MDLTEGQRNKSGQKCRSSDQSLDVMAVNESVKALKASFDRFGDDLSELIVSYLTIEDKFRFQCLSKQWRRLVFNKTYVLMISVNDNRFVRYVNGYKIKYNVFEKCLRRLWALVDIDIDFNVITDEVLRIIAENCHHLRRLSFRWPSDISNESKIGRAHV